MAAAPYPLPVVRRSAGPGGGRGDDGGAAGPAGNGAAGEVEPDHRAAAQQRPACHRHAGGAGVARQRRTGGSARHQLHKAGIAVAAGAQTVRLHSADYQHQPPRRGVPAPRRRGAGTAEPRPANGPQRRAGHPRPDARPEPGFPGHAAAHPHPHRLSAAGRVAAALVRLRQRIGRGAEGGVAAIAIGITGEGAAAVDRRRRHPGGGQ